MADDSRPPRAHRPGQMVINVLANYGYFVIGMGVNFLLTPVLNEQLTKEVFQDWIVLVNVAIYFGLADLGLNSATVRHVAHHIARGELADAGRVMAASRTLFSLIASLFGLAATLIWLFPSLIPESALGLKGIPFETATKVIAFICLHWAMEMVFAPFNAALFGTQRYDLARSASMFARILKAVVIVTLVFRGYGVIMLAVLTVSEALLKGVLQRWMLRRSRPDLPVGLRGADRLTYRKIVHFSVWIVVWSLSYKMILLSDNILVHYTNREALVPLFNATMMPIIAMEQLLWAIAQVLVPYAAAEAARDKRVALKAAINRAARFTLLLAAPIVTYLITAGNGFIGAWMYSKEFPTSFVVQSHELLIVLAPAFLLLFVQQPAIAVLVGSGMVKTPALINLAQAVVKIALSLILVQYYGVMGIALGTVIPLVITNAFVLPFFVRRKLDVGWGDLLPGAIWPALRTALVAVPITVGGMMLIDAGGQAHWRLSHQFGIALAVGTVFVVAGWFLGLAPEDRAFVTERLRRRPHTAPSGGESRSDSGGEGN